MNKKLSKINGVIWILFYIVIFTGTAVTSAMADPIEINTNSTGGDCTEIGIWNSYTNTCTLTRDINQTIKIGNDSITLDGSGHVSTGDSANFDIYQNGTKNTHIENITIKQFTHGIRLDNSNNNTLINNNISNNLKSGIVINCDSGSDNNTLINNNVSKNSGIGILIGSYDNNNNNKLINNNVSNNWLGIILGGNNNILTDNNAYNNIYDRNIGNDIYLTGNNNTLTSNNAYDSVFGIYLTGNNNMLTNNKAYDNSHIGIQIDGTYGSGDNNILTNNNISNNYYGITLNNSNNNIIYHNNVVNNTNQSYDDGANSWDNGYPSGGNYWFDYTGIDSNGDGIGDTPYYIDGGSGAKDRYPFMMENGWTSPSIVVAFPNGGETWERGTTQTIRWNFTGNPGSFVNITLLKGGLFNRTINSSVPIGVSDSGSYNWLISSTQALAGDYKVRITSTTNAAYNDTSDNNFTILAIPAGYGYIYGKVINDILGIAGAFVITNTTVSTTTDTSGSYSLLLPAGNYNLTATKDPAYYNKGSVVVTAISGTTITQDIELLKKPTSNITGSVTRI